jgi:thiamine biosynthesis lipoprotein
MRLISHQKNFMNTTITIKVVKTDESTILIQDRIEEAFGEFDRIVKKYTRFNEDSELSNLNRMSGSWVQVSDEFLYLIEFMVSVAHKSNGSFDPTIIDFLEIYGYDKNYDFTKLDNPELDKLVEKIRKERPSWQEIEIDKKNRKVKLAKGQRIDLGGVGKGYAIDCAFEIMAGTGQCPVRTNPPFNSPLYKRGEGGISNFLIDAGGDIRTNGLNEKKEEWKVGLKTKKESGEEVVRGYIELESGQSLASSGSWARRVKQFHHLINPKTGRPKEAKYSTVYVLAPTGIEADAWATALFVSGDSQILPPDLKQIII